MGVFLQNFQSSKLTTSDTQHALAVVTGAAGGIGLEVVRRLLDTGYRVLAIDSDVSSLTSIPSEMLDLCEIDITDEDPVREAIVHASTRTPLKALVCCAAIFPAQRLADISNASWDRVFSVNVEGSLFACRAALPEMRRAGGGSIVLFASSLARTGGIGAAHYSASKGAILGLARSLALSVVTENIRVNVVSPGLTDTAQPRANMTDQQLLDKAAGVPLKRMGEPKEMAEAAAFLLSDDASFITGQDFRLNGGAGLF
jgi:NAD(P)-dependent dehydrogenase (short-subunit alcohol dehydrogenase family)